MRKEKEIFLSRFPPHFERIKSSTKQASKASSNNTCSNDDASMTKKENQTTSAIALSLFARTNYTRHRSRQRRSCSELLIKGNRNTMQSSKLCLISIIASLATLSILSSSIIVRAFQPTIHSTSSIRLNAQPNNQHDEASVSVSTRRNALQKSAGVAFSILLGGTTAASEANASYSAYTRREEDWKQREKNGGE